MVLTEMESLSGCLEVGAKWDKVLSNGLVGPMVPADLVQRPGDGVLGFFKVHASNMYAKLGECVHRFVVGRRDSAVKGWRNGMMEEPGSRSF